MTIPIIDVHNHANWHGYTVDRIVKNMDEHGISKTWLLSCESTPAEFGVVPRYHGVMDPRGLGVPLWMVVDAMQRYPDRFIGGWAPDPRDSSSRLRLSSAVSLHGIRVYGELKCRMRYDSPDAIATFRYCGELGLPVLFHLEAPEYRLRQQSRDPGKWPEWYGGDISVVDRMCRQCRDTVFIGHGPGFWREISGGAARNVKAYPDGPVRPGSRLLKILRRHSNLYCDLSAGSGHNALARDLEHAKAFLDEFQDRVLFGRDTFDSALLDFLETLGLDPVVRAKILRENAERLLAECGRKGGARHAE